jgi:hypothetical protein
MTNLELEALRRQVEEDYKLDIAAIERLQRRLGGGSKGSVSAVDRAERAERGERQAAAEPNASSQPQGHEARGQQAAPDELTESLRSMFSSYRK